MAIYKTSSLVASDVGNESNNRSILKTPTRISKGDIAAHKMFGSKRKGIQIGKKFRKKGKGVMHGSVSAKMPKSSAISPSIDEFDKMMSKVVGKSPKKSMFSRKQFD
jgi:hypothetical protein